MRLLTWPVAALALLWVAGQSSAQSGDLESRVKKLEMKAEEKTPANGKTAGDKSALNAYFDDGLRLKSNDGNFEARIGAYVITHYTWNGQLNEADGRIDGFSIKESGIEVYGRVWQAFEVYILPRFNAGGAQLKYGWVEFNKWDELKIRVGVFKEPYSAETYVENVKWQDMPENSLLSIHAPNRDIGAMIHGKVAGGIFNYAVGVFNGNGPGIDENSDKDWAIRLSINPGAKSESDFIKHLYIGGGMTRGIQEKALNVAPLSFMGPALYGQSDAEFHQSSTSIADFQANGTVTRAGIDLNYCYGPFELKAEYSYYKAKLEIDNYNNTTFRSDAAMTSVAFWIGGSRTPGKRPQVDKCLFDGGMGAIQIVGRYSMIHLDDTFEEYVGYGGSRNVHEFALAVNYYPNPYVRISAMFTQYEYDKQGTRQVGTADGGETNDENVIILRAQVDF